MLPPVQSTRYNLQVAIYDLPQDNVTTSPILQDTIYNLQFTIYHQSNPTRLEPRAGKCKPIER